MSFTADQQASVTDNIQAEAYNNASKDGVLSLIKRNIQVLKQEIALGVPIDRSMLAEMEAEFRRLAQAARRPQR